MHIEDWIDLHGFAPRDVVSVVEDYLEAAARKGFDEVRLVHGRGKGVQRRNVQERLATHPLVLGYRDAPATRGGLGATLVWLRRVDATGRTRWLWRIPSDHSLAQREWRALLNESISRADRVSWSARDRGPRRLSVSASFPFVRWNRAPDGAAVFADVEGALGVGAREEGGRRSWPLTAAARRFLLDRSVEDWDQHRGLPEDPSLLSGCDVVLSCTNGEVLIHLDEDERERLRAIELVPV